MEITAVKKLKDLVTLSAGHPFRGALVPVAHGDVAVVQIKDVDAESKLCDADLIRVTLSTKKRPDFLKQDDILFVSRGTSFPAAIVQCPLRLTVAAPKLFVLRAKSRHVLPAYIAWYLNHQRAQRYFSQQVVGSSTQMISRQALEDLPIDIPPLDRQELIVNAHRCWLREKQLLRALETKKTQLYAQLLDRALTG